jgi:hypothetical protein
MELTGEDKADMYSTGLLIASGLSKFTTVTVIAELCAEHLTPIPSNNPLNDARQTFSLLQGLVSAGGHQGHIKGKAGQTPTREQLPCPVCPQ